MRLKMKELLLENQTLSKLQIQLEQKSTRKTSLDMLKTPLMQDLTKLRKTTWEV